MYATSAPRKMARQPRSVDRSSGSQNELASTTIARKISAARKSVTPTDRVRSGGGTYWLRMLLGSCLHVAGSTRPVFSGEGAGPSTRRTDPLAPVAERAGKGDRQAVETLLLELGSAFLHTVRRVLGAHHPSVEDVAQEAALGFAQRLPTFRGECTVRHFAMRVALRTALKARRHFAVRSRIGDFSSSEEETLDHHGTSPLEAAISEQRRRVVRAVLDDLTEQIAEAMALHFMLGFTVPEIAEIQAVSQNTVWSRLKLGKRSLKKALTRDERLGELLKGGVR